MSAACVSSSLQNGVGRSNSSDGVSGAVAYSVSVVLHDDNTESTRWVT